jgi:soluble lytic murein transglycosylase
MLKKLQKKQVYLLAGAGMSAFLLGAMVSAPQIGKSFAPQISKSLHLWFKFGNNQQEKLAGDDISKSAVFPLVSQSRVERAPKLAEIAEKASSPDRERARYLLATDDIETSQAKKALDLLAGLEKQYPPLAPYILLKQAHAEDLLGEKGKAADLRRQVLKDYPQSVATVKAIYQIGQPTLQDQAIAKFPSHPLTWEIIRKRLQINHNQSKLQLILAKYTPEQAGIVGVLDQLIASQTPLTTKDWEIIASTYWVNNQFTKAKDAYTKAPITPISLYRIARAWQLAKNRPQAIAAYKQLVQKFPHAPETEVTLLRLAEISPSQEAISYLDQVINNFSAQAPAALEKKAKLLQSLKNDQSANATWKILLGKYSNSEPAAEYRWQIARKKAKGKDYIGAWEWAQPITTNNPTSILAPRAAFWVGKWATTLGKSPEARLSFEYVVSRYPQSYYAWRAANILGLNVGDFNDVRSLNPEIIPSERPVPPAGSQTFKELYLLGQDHDAWLQWEAEFAHKTQPSVAEQFTAGLIELAQGKNMLGIDQISKLEDRETPQEKADYVALSQKTTYWQARYPFPYFPEIQKWSTKRQLNPLLVIALMRQESRFEAKIKSPVGATGLMQMMPDTAKWIAPQANLDFKTINLENPSDNIMLGTWYLDHTHKQYGNNSLLAIASYNAGPGNVSKWLQTIPKTDPDEFVEEIPFDETRNYVRQVFGNYWNYLRLYNPEVANLVAKYTAEHSKLPNR